jgi:hypothetical protein
MQHLSQLSEGTALFLGLSTRINGTGMQNSYQKPINQIHCNTIHAKSMPITPKNYPSPYPCYSISRCPRTIGEAKPYWFHAVCLYDMLMRIYRGSFFLCFHLRQV